MIRLVKYPILGVVLLCSFMSIWAGFEAAKFLYYPNTSFKPVCQIAHRDLFYEEIEPPYSGVYLIVAKEYFVENTIPFIQEGDIFYIPYLYARHGLEFSDKVELSSRREETRMNRTYQLSQALIARMHGYNAWVNGEETLGGNLNSYGEENPFGCDHLPKLFKSAE